MKENILTTIPFGNYNLFKKLYCGSVAEIFLAFKKNEHGSKKLYLIKKFFNHLSTESNKLQGFIKEGEIATSFSHQNIVYSHEFGSVDSDHQPSFFLAMDYVFGKNLAQIKNKEQDSALPVNITTCIVKSVASGLLYAHTYYDPLTLQQQHITHKDISPDNIIVSYSGETKITDFGISQRGPQKGNNNKISGKFKYMSPEQIFNKSLDNRSDIYSLGVVFWECLTGKRLFPDRSDLSTGQTTTSPEVVHPCTFSSDIPMPLGDICMKCLEPEPDARFQSCQELYDMLSGYSGSTEEDTKNLQAYLQERFAKEYRTEVEELLQAQEGKYIQSKEISTSAATQPTEETTGSIEKNVSVINPVEAPNIYSALAVGPECITMTGTVADVDTIFPMDDTTDNTINIERTVTSDATITGDEATTESEFR